LHSLAERHGQRSTVMTSTLAFGEWVQVFGDEKLTTALLDRLGHRSHILTTQGPSYRTKRHATEGSGKTASECLHCGKSVHFFPAKLAIFCLPPPRVLLTDLTS